MKWIAGAFGKRVVHEDWAATNHLRHIDPYLVWFDITDFGGAALPENCLLPIIEERRSAQPRFKTNARELQSLADFLGQEFGPQRGKVSRFEIAPGLVNDDVDEAPAKDPEWRQADPETRRGKGEKIVGFIDYGCAFAHHHFRVPGAGLSTRVVSIWDQGGAVVPPPPLAGKRSLQWRVPPDFYYGTETHRDVRWSLKADQLTLNEYIAQFETAGVVDEEACYRHSGYGPVLNRRATHGTFVMDVATGWPNPLRSLLPVGSARAVQHDADIVFVQLPRHVRGRQVGGLLRANVYDALRYIESCAAKDADIVVNLSYGGYAGPHDGTSVLECAIDEFLRKHRKGRNFDLVIPSGNSRERQLHAKKKLIPGERVAFHWNNLPDDPSDSFVEMWLPRCAGFWIRVTAPGGRKGVRTGWLPAGSAGSLLPDAEAQDPAQARPTAALVFAQRACQSSRGTMALLAVGPSRLGGRRPAAPYGRWTIEVHNRSSADATVHAWCELDNPAFGTEGQPRQAYFSDNGLIDKDGTLNGLAHGQEPIVVGSYAVGGQVAGYSGTGPGRDLPPHQRHAGPALGGLARRGPETLGPSDESEAMPGIAAAALLGSDTVRLSGTSVAAAAVTRQILDGNFQRQPQPQTRSVEGRSASGVVQPPKPKAAPGAHPDNDLLRPDRW